MCSTCIPRRRLNETALTTLILNEWRGRRQRLVNQVIDRAQSAEARNWPEFAASYIALALEIESTSLNELYYDSFETKPTFHTVFEAKIKVLDQAWTDARREAGVAIGFS